MSVNYGSKRVVVGAHYGLRDWLVQRVTGALMVLFTLAVLGQVLLTTGDISYEKWAGIFNNQLMKSLTYTGNSRRRGANFGKPGVRHVSEQPIDLVKAQLALNHLHRTGKLTDEQASTAQAKLMALRPVEIVLLK